MTSGPAAELAEEYRQTTRADGGVVPLTVVTGTPDPATVAALVAGDERPYASTADRHEAARELLEDNAPSFVAKAVGLDLADVRAMRAEMQRDRP